MVQPQKPETKPDHSPVSIPAGSYDREQLEAGLDKAVDRQGSNRDAEVRKAFESSVALVEGQPTGEVNPALLPDHKLVEVPTALDDKGEPTATETVQVYDPKLADQHVGAATIVPSAAEAIVDDKPTDLEKARTAAAKGPDLDEFAGAGAAAPPPPPPAPAPPPPPAPAGSAGGKQE